MLYKLVGIRGLFSLLQIMETASSLTDTWKIALEKSQKTV